jgi:hypothetical protein
MASSAAIAATPAAAVADVNTGTSTTAFVTPDALAGSNLGTRDFTHQTVYNTTACAAYAYDDVKVVPVSMNGMNLVAMIGAVGSNPGVTGTMTIGYYRLRSSTIGSSTTRFDITRPGGNTSRYTYDGTGTDPGIADTLASLQAGDGVVFAAQNFNAANNGFFSIDAVGANYIEITNAAGLAENDKTIGTGSIMVKKFRAMLSTDLSIDSREYNSTTAATPFVPDPNYDDIATGDIIFPMIDTVHTTPATGLVVTASFQLP